MSDAAWTALGVVATGFFGFLGAMVVGRKEKPLPEPEPTPERQVIEDRYGRETANTLTEPLVRILADQRNDLDKVERRWGEARAHVADVHDWIDDGMPSPPGRPARPEWAPSRRTIR